MTSATRYKLIEAVIITMIIGLCILNPMMLWVVACFGVLVLFMWFAIKLVQWAERGSDD